MASSGGATPAISLDAGYGDSLNPYASKTAKFFLAAPTAAAGVPVFRAIAAADIPTLNQNTTGTAAGLSATLAVASGGTGLTTYTANGVLYASGAGTLANGTGLTFDGTRLGLGVPAPFYTLDVAMTSGPFIGSFKNTSTANNQANIVLWSQGESGSAVGYVGTGGSAFSGAFSNKFVVGTQSAHALGLVASGSLRALIDSTGTFRVVGAGTAGSTDAVQFNVAAPANAFKLTASADLALGLTTPSAWGSAWNAFEFGGVGSNLASSSNNNVNLLANGWSNDIEWRYGITAAASRYQSFNGVHTWYNAPSGTANTTLTWVQEMTLDVGGNLQMLTGAVMQYQPAHVSITSAVTLSNADIQSRIIITSGASYTITMPSGSTLNTLVSWAASNIGYDFCIINNASGTISLDANAGTTILGNVSILTGVSAQFRIRRSAAGAYVVYRLS